MVSREGAADRPKQEGGGRESEERAAVGGMGCVIEGGAPERAAEARVRVQLFRRQGRGCEWRC
jgi:hypothetical protein